MTTEDPVPQTPVRDHRPKQQQQPGEQLPQPTPKDPYEEIMNKTVKRQDYGKLKDESR